MAFGAGREPAGTPLIVLGGFIHDGLRGGASRSTRSVASCRTARADTRDIEWSEEERHSVFLDYNQNAKDRTTCSAYSVRPVPDARVSAPLHWREVPDCEPSDFTVLTMPKRFLEIGDPQEGIDQAAGSLEKLLSLQHATRPRALATRRGHRTFARRRASRAGLHLRARGPSQSRPERRCR